MLPCEEKLIRWIKKVVNINIDKLNNEIRTNLSRTRRNKK